MLIHDIADFLVNLTCKDIKPDIYSVFDSPCENNCPNNVNSEKTYYFGNSKRYWVQVEKPIRFR